MKMEERKLTKEEWIAAHPRMHKRRYIGYCTKWDKEHGVVKEVAEEPEDNNPIEGDEEEEKKTPAVEGAPAPSHSEEIGTLSNSELRMVAKGEDNAPSKSEVREMGVNEILKSVLGVEEAPAPSKVEIVIKEAEFNRRAFFNRAAEINTKMKGDGEIVNGEVINDIGMLCFDLMKENEELVGLAKRIYESGKEDLVRYYEMKEVNKKLKDIFSKYEIEAVKVEGSK
jgi:hypothetical protein